MAKSINFEPLADVRLCLKEKILIVLRFLLFLLPACL